MNERLGDIASKIQRARDQIRRFRATASTGSPRPGELLLVMTDSGCEPEWLLLGSDRTKRWSLVVPAEESGLAGPPDVVVGSESTGGPLIVRCAHAVWLESPVLYPRTRSGHVSDVDVARARAGVGAVKRSRFGASAQSLENEADPEYIASDAALGALVDRLLGEYGGLRAGETTRRVVEPRPVRFGVRPTWITRPAAGLSAAAAVVLAVFVLVGDDDRVRDGVYRFRGSGEVGVELEVGDQRCLPMNVEASQPCDVDSDDRVRILYRLDEEVPFVHFAFVVQRADGSLVDVTPGQWQAPALAPTATEGRERCSEGFCELADFPAPKDGLRGTGWAVFRSSPVDKAEVEKSLAADELDDDADNVTYRFRFR